MAEETVIDDVRRAKVWLDRQTVTLAELGSKLKDVEREYLARTGKYSSLPTAPTEEVRRAIANAVDEPGGDFLDEIRASR